MEEELAAGLGKGQIAELEDRDVETPQKIGGRRGVRRRA